jgi:hypothetical protein
MRIQRDSTERVAAAIVGILSAVALRVDCAMECDAICYAVRSRSLKLRSIVLNRGALRRLLTAANGAVKIEYLKRDLLRTAVHRAEYRYPRRSRQAVIQD